MFEIHCNGYLSSEATFKQAIKAASDYFDAGHPDEIGAVVVVKKLAGAVAASFSPLPITGTFQKQEWTGHKLDQLNVADSIEFDATAHILRMDYEDLQALRDDEEQAGRIGYEHVTWDGPCAVYIVDNICRYFAVDSLDEITEEHFAFVKERVQPRPAQRVTIKVTIEVDVSVQPGVKFEEIAKNLQVATTTDMPGVVINSAKVLA
jgi:hypothetical protein